MRNKLSCIEKTKSLILNVLVTAFLVGFAVGALANIEVDSISARNSEGFKGERYRGWLWFEEKPSEIKHKNKEQNQDKKEDQITAEQARREIKELKRKMDESRDIMIARPTPLNVMEYIKLEEKMWERALALDSAQRQAKFMYPKYFDKLRNPENVHAVKFKRKMEQEEIKDKIKNFAKEFDLVFFSKGNCVYCKEFAPVLKRFASEFGFKIEEASIDGGLSGLFVGKKMSDLASLLGIEATPAVVVVSKDGKSAFEFIRGYASMTEMEEYAGLAIEYVSSRKSKLPNMNENIRKRRKYE